MSAPEPHDPQDPGVLAYRKLTPQEDRARRRRILATGLALAAFVVVIFLVSLSRLHSNIAAGAAG